MTDYQEKNYSFLDWCRAYEESFILDRMKFAAQTTTRWRKEFGDEQAKKMISGFTGITRHLFATGLGK